MKVYLSRPNIEAGDISSVVSVLKTPYLSLGPKQDIFQDKFSRYIGTKYAVAVNSGTSGLDLVMQALGISSGDEVITTAYSFIASSNSILFNRAIPVFADIDRQTFNIDICKIEKKITSKTKAILAVHVFGLPTDMISINRIARKYELRVIEDSCEALGASIDGKKAGTFSDAAVFGFYPNKQITTGEGGMVVTDNSRIAKLITSLKNQGRSADGKFVRLGYNYRLSDINCALGISQLDKINRILQRRLEVAKLYNSRINAIGEVTHLADVVGYKRSWFVYIVKLSDKYSLADKHIIMKDMRRHGVDCGDYFPAIHLTPFYKKQFGFKRGDFPVTEQISDRTFALPFYNNITKKQIDYVIYQLKRAILDVKKIVSG